MTLYIPLMSVCRVVFEVASRMSWLSDVAAEIPDFLSFMETQLVAQLMQPPVNVLIFGQSSLFMIFFLIWTAIYIFFGRFYENYSSEVPFSTLRSRCDRRLFLIAPK